MNLFSVLLPLLNVYELPVYELPVYELPVYELPVYKLPVRARSRLRPCPRQRLYPRVVYPVFCLNADGSQRVDVLTRTELAGWALNS